MNFSHGQYFYSLFSETINQQLLKNLDVIIVRLMESSVGNPQMVLDLFFKRAKSKGNIRSNNFIIVVRSGVCSRRKSALDWISDSSALIVFRLSFGVFLSWPTGATIMISGSLTLLCSQIKLSGKCLPISWNFGMSLHSTSDQKCHFKGGTHLLCFTFHCRMSQSTGLGFVLDKTKLKNKLQLLMGI